MNIRALSAENKNDGASICCLEFAALLMATLLLMPTSHAGSSGSYRPSDAVSFEAIPGSTVKRVILTEKAAERIGIETGHIGEARIVRRQLVGGQVVLPVELTYPAMVADASPFAAFGRAAATEAPRVRTVSDSDPDTRWIHVTLSKGELDRMNLDEPVRILPLATRGDFDSEIKAESSGIPPVADPKRSMLSLYYVVPREIKGLFLNDRVRVEMQVEGNGEKRMVAPYESVYYDGEGDPWVYVQKKPLVYERQRIGIERIQGNQAVLHSGPPVGTPVVTVGAALLYGAEVIFKR